MSHIGEMSNAHRILFKNSEGKRPLQRPKLVRCEDSIKMDLKEI
jgi:hypothetical protein